MNAPCLGQWILAASLIGAAASGAQARKNAIEAVPVRSRSAASGSRSGVYGFSGARSGDNAAQGVIGECIWIFDRSNHTQMASGNCLPEAPGQFRVALDPGRYVVHGPGGNRAIEVKPGHWVKVISIVTLPQSF